MEEISSIIFIDFPLRIITLKKLKNFGKNADKGK